MIGRLDPGAYRDLVRRALEEDVRDGDITSAATVPAAARAQGVFLAKQDCVVAGLDVALEAFRQIEPGVEIIIRAADGERCASGATVAIVAGSARALLAGERTALNFLQRLSGI